MMSLIVSLKIIKLAYKTMEHNAQILRILITVLFLIIQIIVKQLIKWLVVMLIGLKEKTQIHYVIRLMENLA